MNSHNTVVVAPVDLSSPTILTIASPSVSSPSKYFELDLEGLRGDRVHRRPATLTWSSMVDNLLGESGSFFGG